MEIPKTVLGAIYDMDGTLLNNRLNPLDIHSDMHEISRLKALHKLAQLEPNKFGVIAEVSSEESLLGFINSADSTIGSAMFTILQERGVIEGTPEDNEDILQKLIELKNSAYLELLKDNATPVLGADKFVRELSDKYSLKDHNAIASSGIERDIKLVLDKFNLIDLFPDSRIIDFAKTSKHKPDPEPFNKAFLSLGIDDKYRSSVIAFEDDPRGIASARKVGLFVIAITTLHTKHKLANVSHDVRPNLIVDSYEEAASYLLR